MSEQTISLQGGSPEEIEVQLKKLAKQGRIKYRKDKGTFYVTSLHLTGVEPSQVIQDDLEEV